MTDGLAYSTMIGAEEVHRPWRLQYAVAWRVPGTERDTRKRAEGAVAAGPGVSESEAPCAEKAARPSSIEVFEPSGTKCSAIQTM